MKRPEVTYENLKEIDGDRPQLSSHEKNQLEVQIKYEGYISKQLAQIEKFKKLESKTLEEDIVNVDLDQDGSVMKVRVYVD